MLLKEEGGQAPGPDKIRYVDLSPKEVGRLAGDYSRLILEGEYRPQGVRPCPIPKPGSDEKRVLKISSIFDRMVAKALSTALEPHWEQVFVDQSWGFRPNRGVWKMLAHLEVTRTAEDRWVTAIHDVKRAFDNIRVGDVLDAHRRLFEREDVVPLAPAERSRLMGLIAAVTKGPEPNRLAGISQGNPFSPLAMNAVLHHAHDEPLLDNSEHPSWPSLHPEGTSIALGTSLCPPTRPGSLGCGTLPATSPRSGPSPSWSLCRRWPVTSEETVLALRLRDVRVGVDRPHLRIRPAVGKRGRARTVPLWWDAGTLADLTGWKTQRQQQGAGGEDLFVCPMLANRRGRALSRHALRLRFQRACRALGAERARRTTIHHGRHTFVSHALAGGRTLAEVRDAAGHSHVGVTSPYLHVAVEDDAAVGDLFRFRPSPA